MSFWTDKRVIVTGGHGFLGQHVVEQLQTRGCKEIVVPRSREFDLRDVAAIRTLLNQAKPHILIHLAAICGGIEANRQRPGTFFYDNAIMGIQLIEQARLQGIQKTVVLGTVCAYPKHTATPFKEDDIWNGYPEETNAPYGLAKKMLLVQLQAYRDQYQFPGIYLLPVNLYGPRDNFDLTTSHVIPAMIRKMVEAKEKGASELPLWGTGNVSREFLFAEDCADGILLAAEKYNKPLPVNLGTGNEMLIRDLAALIAKLTGFTGKILWDSTKPDGQPKRRLDTTRAEKEFGFKAKTGFETGLKKTIDWYLQNQKSQK
jgi:GDP-L-fucose synthase